jgi:myosin heavy subunit
MSLHTDPKEATHQKNAIIRYIYRQLFKFIIQTINSRCFRGKCDHHLSCLDFPGFENLQNNTLDQLCINYCDERLQGYFIEKSLKNEVQLYEQEGLFFGEIVAQENSKLLKLFHSKNNGMFTHIEKESTTSSKSSTKDDNILSKFYLTYVQSNATKTSLYSQETPKSSSFAIKHYKAAVTYNPSGIVSSSTQDLPTHVLKLLQSSKSTLFQNILSFGSTKKAVSQIGNKTVELVKDVSKILNETLNSNCNFVFCVKSNESEQKDVMDYPCMLKQLKSFEIPSLVKIVRMVI